MWPQLMYSRRPSGYSFSMTSVAYLPTLRVQRKRLTREAMAGNGWPASNWA